VAPLPDSVRSQKRRAAALALIAGYIDSYTLLNYRVFASFMSGNTTQSGLNAGRGELLESGYHLLPIPLFMIGIIAGILILHSGLRHAFRLLCALVAVLLAAALTADGFTRLGGWFTIMTLSLAMGVMNVTITRVGGQPVSLGYVTGDLHHLAEHVALAIKRTALPAAQGLWDTHGQRAVHLTAVWAAFLMGAALSPIAWTHLAIWALLPPILLLLAAAVSKPRP